nr:uncharacterized protein LOC113804132 [Penaeus vannamei]
MKKGKDSLAGGGASDGVTLRRPLGTATPAPTTPSPYSFMRRSCTFVAESSLGLRKSALRTSLTNHGSSARTPAPAVNKVVKDRKNLAMQVRQKKELLEESANGHTESDNVTGRGGGGSGRVSRLVGGLRAWSSTEDVRQSVMGAIGRTVSVSRRVKQAFSRPDNSKPDTAKAQSTKANQAKANADTTKAKSSNVNGTKAQRPVNQTRRHCIYKEETGGEGQAFEAAAWKVAGREAGSGAPQVVALGEFGGRNRRH